MRPVRHLAGVEPHGRALVWCDTTTPTQIDRHGVIQIEDAQSSQPQHPHPEGGRCGGGPPTCADVGAWLASEGAASVPIEVGHGLVELVAETAHGT